MRIRQIKVGPDQYFVDVLYRGWWEPMNSHIPISAAAVRKLRRFWED